MNMDRNMGRDASSSTVVERGVEASHDQQRRGGEVLQLPHRRAQAQVQAQASENVDGERAAPVFVADDNQQYFVLGGNGNGHEQRQDQHQERQVGQTQSHMRTRGSRTLTSTSNVIPAPSSSGAPNRGNIAMIVPRGHKLRDEFVCPITRELITEPVIAADGHTYDRTAIERWLHSHSSSPKTGEPLDHLHLVPNHNLKRLLRDMLREGGQALYCVDSDSCAGTRVTNPGDPTDSLYDGNNTTDGEPQLALVRELVLTCRCLGPVESDWIGRSFRVTEAGAMGGRRRPNESSGSGNADLQRREFVQFTDATVSRKHFEITFNQDKQQFFLRDLGSAGGTFIRIPPGVPRSISAGMMIMLGKHQLVALESPISQQHAPFSSNAHHVPRIATEQRDTLPCGDEEPLEPILQVAHEDNDMTPTACITANRHEYHRSNTDTAHWDQIALEEAAATTDIHTPKYGELSLQNGTFAKRQEGVVDTVQDGNASDTNSQEHHGEGELLDGGDGESFADRTDREGFVQSLHVQDECEPIHSSLADSRTAKVVEQDQEEHPHPQQLQQQQRMESLQGSGQIHDNHEEDQPLLILRCFAPEGTPIQGHEYPITRHGATLGRKAGNTISFSHKVESTCVGIDSSISGEHATIAYNEDTRCLELNDGVIGKGRGSTNGTWVRLSGMHEESRLHPLTDKTEILIGTVRFLVSVDEVVVEKDIYE